MSDRMSVAMIHIYTYSYYFTVPTQIVCQMEKMKYSIIAFDSLVVYYLGHTQHGVPVFVVLFYSIKKKLNIFVLGSNVPGIFSAHFHQRWMSNLYLFKE